MTWAIVIGSAIVLVCAAVGIWASCSTEDDSGENDSGDPWVW